MGIFLWKQRDSWGKMCVYGGGGEVDSKVVRNHIPKIKAKERGARNLLSTFANAITNWKQQQQEISEKYF